jgi:hypothetical protein
LEILLKNKDDPSWIESWGAAIACGLYVNFSVATRGIALERQIAFHTYVSNRPALESHFGFAAIIRFVL